MKPQTESKTMPIKIGRRIRLSHPINFILLEDGGTIPVQELTDAELVEYGNAWTAQLIDHARSKR